MNKKLSIAIDGRGLRSTTGRYVRELLNNLQEIDDKNDYHIIVNPEDTDSWQPSSPNFFIHIVQWKHYTFGEQLGFARFLYSLKADLVHFTMPQQPLLYFRKKVTTVHDLTLVKFANDRKFKQLVLKVCLKIFIKTSKIVFTLAEFTRAEIVEYAGISPDKVVVAHPSGDAMAKDSRVYVGAKGKQYIMYVGNAFPYKNIQRLIDAHQILLKDQPDLWLLIVGKSNKDTEALFRKAKAKNYRNIDFTGFVNEQELAWLYKNAKAYVFPSLNEGFGMPPLEAMHFDLPVVSSNASVMPEICGDAAHYFNPLDVNEMSKSMNEVLTNKELRKKLIANGQKRRKMYSWDKMSQIIHKVYLETIESSES